MRAVIVLLLVIVSGCASPRLWVARSDENSGIIAYQNYDPKSDNGARIERLIPCYPYKMVANPIYGRNVTPTAYGYNSYGNGSGGYAYALDGGYVETAEFHYQCIPNKSLAPSELRTANAEKAHKLKKSECENGNSSACADLALFYQKEGDMRNYEINSEKACRSKTQSASWACASLAEYYQSTKKDLSSSTTYYGLSCEVFRASTSNKYEVPDGCAIYGLRTNNKDFKEIGLSEMKSRCFEKSAFACYKTAAYFCESNEKENALTFFELALRSGYVDWRSLENDHALDLIRKDPRFAKLITEFKK